jgi:hypothetical protein
VTAFLAFLKARARAGAAVLAAIALTEYAARPSPA